MKNFILMCMVAITSIAQAQQTTVTVRGLLKDATNNTVLVGATVLLLNVKDSARSKYGVTDTEGKFLIENVERAFYKINVNSLGYKPYTRIIRIQEVDINLGKIAVQQDVEILKAVDIIGNVVPVEQKGDTIKYNADAFTVNPDASTKDLVSKMPGIVVDDSGVTANGETVEQVLLDGKRFFGQDPLLSLNTIPAEVVKAVEVFDQRSEQAQLTGYDDGNTTKTMNVVTKIGKRNGLFGKLYTGYGSENQYAAGGNVNSFNKDKRLTVIGMSNNINQQNFNSEDLAGVSGGQRRSSRHGGENSNFMTANQNGITATNSIGINFTDDWGKLATFEGSYFFNQSDNTNNQYTSRELYSKDGNQIYSEELNAATDNMNHRVNMRVTYNVNKKNKFIFRPTVSFQDNNSSEFTKGATTDEFNQLINNTDNNYLSKNLAYNLSGDLLYQHKFEKIGRTISLNINGKSNPVTKENYYEDVALDSLTEYLTDENDYTLGSSITYTEPVGNTAQLSTGYTLKYNGRDSEKNTYMIDSETNNKEFDVGLSNYFNSTQITHIPSIVLSNRTADKFYNFGVSFQHVTMNNEQIFPQAASFNKNYSKILPSAVGRVNLKGGGNMFIHYRASTNAPSVNQLQNVVDNSNPFFLSIGNPDLDQNYSHSMFLRLSKSNTGKNRSVSNFTRMQFTNNYITNATQIVQADSLLEGNVEVQRGAQISIPINMNGYWNISNNSTYSLLLSKIKTNLNTSVGLSYVRQPGRVNSVENIANTYGGNASVSLVSNFSENIDFNIYYKGSVNSVDNSFTTQSNTTYSTQTIGGKFNFIFWKGLVFRSDIYYQEYLGASDGFNTYYTLWNMALAKKFLKNDMAELELSAFDILKQNRSISQSVNPSYFEETQTQVLQQYFMIKFTLQIRKFKAA